MAVVKTRYTRAIKKKQRKRVEQKQEKQECNMIGYKARANIEKKKNRTENKVWEIPAGNFTHHIQNIWISQPFQKAKNIALEKKTFVPTECLR